MVRNALARLPFLVIAGALVLSGCGGDTTDQGDSTSTSVAATSSTTSTTGATTTSAGTTTTAIPPTVGEPQTDDYTSPGFPGSGRPALLDDVRTETYSDFSRIVFDFGEAIPEFQIGYVEGPIRARPSDNDIDVAGQAFLEIVMAPASGVDLSGDEPVVVYQGPDRIAIDADIVTELVKIEDFESHLGWVVGLGELVPFSFSTLQQPPRLVIDLHTGGSS